MRFCLLLTLWSLFCYQVVATQVDSPQDEVLVVNNASVSFEPFTGKVTGSKVRLRLQPSLDGHILRELSPGELLVVTGETDEFYAVRPEKGFKGYIYRAYVLDDVVEANNVNVRLEPDTQAPIITQLSQGQRIVGSTCSTNGKWLSIDVPEDISFYVAKDYIEKIGDVALFQRIESKKAQLAARIDILEKQIKAELQKPFQEIHLGDSVSELKFIASKNQDIPEYAEKALALVKMTQEEYLQLSQVFQTKQKDLAQELAKTQKEKAAIAMVPEANTRQNESRYPHRLISLLLEQQENALIAQAIQAGNISNKESFYSEQLRDAESVSGQLIPYERTGKNYPGDYMLVDAKTKMPLAYLYSSTVDLNKYLGLVIQIKGAARPNHYYALPAYFVLEATLQK